MIESSWRYASQPGWPRPEEALQLLRDHMGVDFQSLGVDAFRALLTRASEQAPDDDRVWLAWANLAIRTGQFDDARRRIDDCLGRRPEDPSVWRAELDWGLGTAHVAAVRRALGHLPADRFSSSEVERLRAWLAERRGDTETERRGSSNWWRTSRAIVPRRRGWPCSRPRPVESSKRVSSANIKPRWTRPPSVTSTSTTSIGSPTTHPNSPGWRRPWGAGSKLSASSNGLSVATPTTGPPGPPSSAFRARKLAGAPPKQTLAQLLAVELAPETGLPSAGDEPVDGATPQFRDDAHAAGLSFVYENGESSIHQLPEFAGGGVGLIDYDGDGWLDVFLVQGGRFPPDPAQPSRGDRLFRNRRDGTFDDVTDASGIGGMTQGYGHGVAVGDYDNDGHADLFVTRWRSYALYRNRGDGTFEDVTAAGGPGGRSRLADIGGFRRPRSRRRPRPVRLPLRGLGCRESADLLHLSSQPGGHRLQSPGSRTAAPTMSSATTGPVHATSPNRRDSSSSEGGGWAWSPPTLTTTAASTCSSPTISRPICCSSTAAAFGSRRRLSSRGVAANAEGGYQAGMGVACGDLDGDGRLDLAVTNFYAESTTSFRNLGRVSSPIKRQRSASPRPPATGLVSAIAFLDVDNDGRLDLLTANGHVNDYRPSIPYTMPIQLLRRGADDRFRDVSDRAGPPFMPLHLGRGLAAGDLDNDGRVDALVVCHNEPLVYLHNQTHTGHFVTLAAGRDRL